MKTVAQMLKLKLAGVISIRPDVPVLDALKLLADKDVGAVLVMDGPRLIGIISERDYARKVALRDYPDQAWAIHDEHSAYVLVRE